MSWKNPQKMLLLVLVVVVMFVFFSTNPTSADATVSSKRKLDEGSSVVTPPGSSDSGIKCGPCDNPSPPPPSPPPPSPPPPKSTPSKANCPPPPGLPPPPPAFNYVSGPPGETGELYPIDYSGVDHMINSTNHVGKWVILVLGLLLVFA